MQTCTPSRGRTAGAAVRLAVVLAIHVMVLFALLRLDPQMRRSVEPVLVSLIAPPRPLEAPPQPPEPAPPPKPIPARALVKPAPRAPSPPPAAAAPMTLPDANVTPNAIVAPEAMPPPAVTAETGASAAAPASAVAHARPSLVAPPRFDAAYLNNPSPEYPRLARRMGEQGKVVLRVLVAATGNPERVVVHASSGSSRLDQAAREAVERWRFVPARQGDAPTSAWVLVPITFVLEG